MQVLGSKSGFVLVSFPRRHPPAPAPKMGRLLFFPFPSFRSMKPWLSGLTGLSLSVGNSIKSFLYLDASPVMTSCGQVLQVCPGCVRRGRGSGRGAVCLQGRLHGPAGWPESGILCQNRGPHLPKRAPRGPAAGGVGHSHLTPVSGWYIS